jgi:cell division protein FtsI (penicillin-binding protein 3)
LLAVGLLALWCVLIGRTIYLHLGPNTRLRERVEQLRTMSTPIKASRGRIVDRNGQLLAQDAALTCVEVNPSLLCSNRQVAVAAKCLAWALGLPEKETAKKIDRPERRGMPVYHFAATGQVQRLKGAASAFKIEPGSFAFKPEPCRSYPAGRLACHVVGFANREGVGGAGIEQSCDASLKPHDGLLFGVRDGTGRELFTRRSIKVEAGDGADVELTLDQNVQYFAEKGLAWAIEEFEAEAGWVVVEDVKTGGVLAMASWPAYDPGAFNEASAEERLNRAIGVNYEPGSIFKVGVVAAALNEGLISTNDQFDCEMGLWNYKGRPLHDFHPFGILDVTGILSHSSNVGAAKIAVMLGEQRLHRYLSAYGFGRATGCGLPGEETGILYSLANWKRHGIDITRVAMGHSVAVTALQMVNFLCCIGNDGYLMKPHVIARVRGSDGEVLRETVPEVAGRPLSERTARQMREMMSAVTGPEGTAKRAKFPGYQIAGKTGTAEKLVGGHYVKNKNVASFMGLVPADKPEIGIIVVLDAPRKNRTAGLCAAPFFAKVAEPIAHYLDIPPEDASPAFEWHPDEGGGEDGDDGDELDG